MMRYPFPSECIDGVVFDFDVEAGTWQIEQGEEIETFTTAELLEYADVGEVEFYLGLYNRYHFEYNDNKLDRDEWLSTVRATKVYAPTLKAAYSAFHNLHPEATNVDTTSLQRVRRGRVLVKAIAA